MFEPSCTVTSSPRVTLNADLESLAIGLKSNGYNISFGIIGEYGPLQNSLSKEGIKCYCFKVNKKPLIKSYFSNFKYWSKVIKKDNIEIYIPG